MHPKQSKTSGQALVEFALLLSLLLALFTAMMDFTMALNAQLALWHAVSEAGYVAMHNPGDDAQVLTRLREEMAHIVPVNDTTTLQIAPLARTCSGAQGPEVTISATLQHRYFFGVFTPGETITLTGKTVVQQLGYC